MNNTEQIRKAVSDLLECNMSDPNKNRANAGVWYTINAQQSVIERLRAALLDQPAKQEAPQCVECDLIGSKACSEHAGQEAPQDDPDGKYVWYVPDDNGKPLKATAYLTEAEAWKANGHTVIAVPIAAVKQAPVKQKTPEQCFCDRMYPDANPDATCGDCPRDYVKQAPEVVTNTNWVQSMDARVWADEFCKLNTATDKGTMIGWFANAIMAGFDEATRRATAAPEVVAMPSDKFNDKDALFNLIRSTNYVTWNQAREIARVIEQAMKEQGK